MSKWMVPVDKLDSQQRDFILNSLNKNKNQWISGFAGSGKSVLLMHALATITEKEPEASILIVYFTHSLRQMFIVGMNELKINQRKVSLETYINYQKNPRKYDYILCDEVQDLTADVLVLMKENCKRLYVSGDPYQSIYQEDPQTGRPVVNVSDIANITNTDEFKLTTIHRLTKSVIKLISSLLPSMGIFSAKENSKTNDVTARLAKFSSEEDEVSYVTEQAFNYISTGESSVVILPSHNDLLKFASLYNEVNNRSPWCRVNNQYNKPNYNLFNQYYNGSKLHCIGNGYGDLWKASRDRKLILMTYHSAKGLDFDSVYLPFLNADANIQSETLFMVGLSRSKNALILSYTNTMHNYLKSIEKDCHNISSTLADSSEDNEFDF